MARTSLKQFIKAVRSAKTLADEKRVIQTESAALRASFREESSDHTKRRTNVSKLLYLYTLGERTHFGQVECLKLLASPTFADKRLGYLGAMLLLDENQEVLTLVTNSLQNDLNSQNPSIIGLALCTVANIASPEMARDLFPYVDKLMTSASASLRKKAALAAMRIVRKDEELQEVFVPRAVSGLMDRNNGALLAHVTLAIDLCTQDPDLAANFRQAMPHLIKTLRALNSSGYSPEHDVQGIADPFLQVKILRLLGVLGRNDPDSAEQLNDVLTLVCSSTESTKSVGNAILYEAVCTILEIEADSSLRVLGVNILGKFLGNRDNNIRYVALNTLNRLVVLEPNAIQRHRATVLDCLKDPDVSIRRRALDIAFSLVNEKNVRVMIRDLLNFLQCADTEFKPTMTTQICLACDRFAPTRRWRLDTSLTVLQLAGNYVREQILSSIIRLIGTSSGLEGHATMQLYQALRKDQTQEGLTIAALWAIGEFAESLIAGTTQSAEDDVHAQTAAAAAAASPVPEAQIVDVVVRAAESEHATETTLQYALTAAVKLSVKVHDPQRLHALIAKYRDNISLDVQQRACEFVALDEMNDVKRGVLARMPPPQIREENRVLGTTAPKATARSKKSKDQEIMDLIGISDVAAVAADEEEQEKGKNVDLMAGLFASETGSTGTPGPATASSRMNDILGLFDAPTPGAGTGSAMGTPMASSLSKDYFGSGAGGETMGGAGAGAGEEILVLDKGGLRVTLTPQPSAEASAGQATLLARMENTSLGDTIDKLNLEMAVPRSMKVRLQPISSQRLDAMVGTATQVVRVQAPTGAQVKLRVRISWVDGAGNEVREQVDVSRLPANLVA